jgi:hypothetical protein
LTPFRRRERRLNWSNRWLTPSSSNRGLISRRSSRSRTPTTTGVELSRSSWRTPSATSITTLSSSLTVLTLTLTLTIVGICVKLEVGSITLTIGSESLRNVLLKEIRNDLVSFEKSLDQSLSNIGVTLIVERGSETQVANTTSTTWYLLAAVMLIVEGKLTDTVNVLLDTTILRRRQVVVDNVHTIVKVQTLEYALEV